MMNRRFRHHRAVPNIAESSFAPFPMGNNDILGIKVHCATGDRSQICSLRHCLQLNVVKKGPKAKLSLLPIVCLIANYCTRWRCKTLKDSSRMGGRGGRISAPLPLKKNYRMLPLSADTSRWTVPF
jgi:hypothetical protein